MAYTKEYWEREGERIAEERRKRYATDPEYREAVLARSREYREKKKQEREAFLAEPYIVIKGKHVKAMTAEDMCESLGITDARLKYLQKKGYIPAALEVRPARLYTYHQSGMIRDLEDLLGQHSRYLRATKTPEGQAAQAALTEMTTTIHDNWEK